MLVGLLLLACWPLIRQPGEWLLAWRGAEVWGHAWTWWWHGEALPAWPGGTGLAEGAERWPVIDPLPALVGALVSRSLGIVTAWNGMALASIAGAFAGGWWLAGWAVKARWGGWCWPWALPSPAACCRA
jgi:hypothetical protein